MFAILFTVILEAIAIFVIIALFFWLFLYFPIRNWRRTRQLKKEIAMLARIKYTSDSSKEILSFIAKNAKNIEDDMFEKLLSRIEYLKADQFIKTDESKYRFESAIEEEVLIEREIKSESSISR